MQHMQHIPSVSRAPSIRSAEKETEHKENSMTPNGYGCDILPVGYSSSYRAPTPINANQAEKENEEEEAHEPPRSLSH